MNGITIYTPMNTPALQNTVDRLRKLGMNILTNPSSDITHLLLNVPSFDNSGALKGGGDLAELLAQIPKNVTIIGGNLPGILQDYKTIDLLKDARYLAENAAITADCAISLARQRMTVAWKGCPVLILGWGRIGKCLAAMLRSAGADVTVAARKEADIAMLQGLGYGAEDVRKLHYGLMRYRVIFNTIPFVVLSAGQTQHCQQNCLLVELASQPGIEGNNIVSALGLPGKYAPESSGKLIASTVVRLLLGREC